MAIPTKVKLQVVEMRAEGLSYARIAEALQIAKQTAVDISKEQEDRIDTLRAITMEAFLEEQRVSRRGRIEQLSTLLTRLRAEIERRDLTDVPTDKLISLFIKTTDTLKGEVCDPSIRSTDEQRRDQNEREGLAALSGF